MKREGIPGDPEVARRVRMARAGANNMNQAELAAECALILGHMGISRSIISRIELADRDAEGRLLAAIAVVTGADYDWLNAPNKEAASVNSAKGAQHSSDRDSRTYLIPDWHPINAGVTDLSWFARDEQCEGQTEIVIDIDRLKVAV